MAPRISTRRRDRLPRARRGRTRAVEVRLCARAVLRWFSTRPHLVPPRPWRRAAGIPVADLICKLHADMGYVEVPPIWRGWPPARDLPWGAQLALRRRRLRYKVQIIRLLRERMGRILRAQ
eukprot:gene8850-7534_t